MIFNINDSVMNDYFHKWYKKFDKLPGEIGSNQIFIARNNKLNYKNMQKNLHMIFGDNISIDNQVCLFDDVLEFLVNHIKVNGIDRLFSKHFYDIEWNMFLEADFGKGEMKIYRDHFVHQIRNAFLGYFLIWEFNLLENIKILIKSSSTAFGEFIRQFSYQENIDEEKFYNNVIMKSWFISSLFHDIGYPLAYHQRSSAKMDMYMPYLRVLDNRRQMDFIELSALLSDTYLFKMVEHEELRKSYEKFDHGMLSAICLLLHYYHTGAIHKLNKEDYCSIELAAYSIYVHTRKYTFLGDKKAMNNRPLFYEDPLAYLLRLCDDLQEWSRVYFIVDDNSNLLICDKCKGLVSKNQEDSIIYRCKCGHEFHKITSINYRKINFVEVCEELTVENESNSKIVFELKYNLIKLLEVIGMDKQYAYYRNKELKKLNLLLFDQEMLPDIDILYYISNNHMEIKLEIIKNFIERYNDNQNIEDMIKHKVNEVCHVILSNINDMNEAHLNSVLIKEVKSLSNYLIENDNKRELIVDEEPPSDYLNNIFLYNKIYLSSKRV